MRASSASSRLAAERPSWLFARSAASGSAAPCAPPPQPSPTAAAAARWASAIARDLAGAVPRRVVGGAARATRTVWRVRREDT